MFIHYDCDGLVYAAISDAFEVLAENLVMGARKVTFPGIVMIKEREDGLKIKFICTSCNKPIPQSSVRVKCNYCGSTLRFSEAYKITGHSGIYCEKHIKSLQNDVSGGVFCIADSLRKYIKE